MDKPTCVVSGRTDNVTVSTVRNAEGNVTGFMFICPEYLKTHDLVLDAKRKEPGPHLQMGYAEPSPACTCEAKGYVDAVVICPVHD